MDGKTGDPPPPSLFILDIQRGPEEWTPVHGLMKFLLRGIFQMNFQFRREILELSKCMFVSLLAMSIQIWNTVYRVNIAAV